jgi:hypothetical protein
MKHIGIHRVERALGLEKSIRNNVISFTSKLSSGEFVVASTGWTARDDYFDPVELCTVDRINGVLPASLHE